MAKQKILNFVSLIFNAFLFATVLVCFILKFNNTNSVAGYISSGWGIFKFFTNLANVFLGLVSFLSLVFILINIIKKKEEFPTWLMILKLMATVSCFIVFLIVVFFLVPEVKKVGQSGLILFSGANLFYHGLVPLLSAISFIFVEVNGRLRLRYTPFALLPVILYAVFYLLNIEFKWIAAYDTNQVAYYDWYRLLSGNALRDVFAVIFLFIGAYLLSLLFYGLNLYFRHIICGYEDDEGVILNLDDEVGEPCVSDEEIIEDKIIGKVGDGTHLTPLEKESTRTIDENYDEVTKTYTTNTGTIHTIVKKVKKTPTKNTFTTTTDLNLRKDTFDNINKGVRTYHISHHLPSKQWQVKLAKGEKAIKIFATQAEAIEYAKGLVKKNGGSIRVHSINGRLRKE